MKYPIYQQIARQISHRQRLLNSDEDTSKGLSDCEDKLDDLADLLPSGSGIDDGTRIDLEKSRPDMVILNSSYHVMIDGMYSYWRDYTVTIFPSLCFPFMLDIDLDEPENTDDIQDYLYQTYEQALTEEVESI